MLSCCFLTGNKGKWQIAANVFARYGVPLAQLDVDVPEIQSLDVAEVAVAAVQAVAAPPGVLIKSDVGYYFEALNGFPGPLIKFINKSLTADDILALMRGKTNRRVALRECLACRLPDDSIKTFEHTYYARVTEAARGRGTPVNQVLVIDGFDRALGECTADEMQKFWTDNLHAYHAAARFLAGLAGK